MKHSWQYHFDGRPIGHVRGKWDDAVQDAIDSGACTRQGPRVIKTNPLAAIVRLNVRGLHIVQDLPPTKRLAFA